MNYIYKITHEPYCEEMDINIHSGEWMGYKETHKLKVFRSGLSCYTNYDDNQWYHQRYDVVFFKGFFYILGRYKKETHPVHFPGEWQSEDFPIGIWTGGRTRTNIEKLEHIILYPEIISQKMSNFEDKFKKYMNIYEENVIKLNDNMIFELETDWNDLNEYQYMQKIIDMGLIECLEINVSDIKGR